MHAYLQKVLKEHNTPKKELVGVLIKNLGKYYPERSHKVVHASDVTKPDFCAKQYALMDLHKKKRPDRYLPPALKATFDVGNATADLVREEWMGERAVGHWMCPQCTSKVAFQSRPDYPCVVCKKARWKYVEVSSYDKTTGISGSIDLLADLSHDKVEPVVIVEVKIMKGSDWEKLIAPLAEHRIRTCLYLWLVAQDPSEYGTSINTQRAKILYVSREFGKKSHDHGEIIPFKEFDIERDDSVVEPLLVTPMILQHWRENPDTAPMPPGICTDIQSTCAKKCPVREECFKNLTP